MNTITGLLIACLALSVYGLPSSQIVGGNDALDGLYPYQASLRHAPEESKGSTHFCSGAIISKRFVITIAQCLIGIENPYKLQVAVGSNYLNAPYAVYDATDCRIHAGFNKKLYINDIGLIRVSKDIVFNENVQPIALPSADRDYNDYPLVATGWGSMWSGGSQIVNRLQEIVVKGYAQGEICKDKDYYICTFTTMGEGMCIGDAGNPLVADGVLVGLVSFSYGLCGSGAPDVSTKVYSYISWINYYTEERSLWKRFSDDATSKILSIEHSV